MLNNEQQQDQREDQRRAFINELWRRFEEVQQWAIEHWPDRERPLSSSDFVEARKEILGLRAPGGDLDKRRQAEPAEGGAQYISTAPAPWP
ncbi:hypothetical protein [Janthinobacterium agaricidamnosum]|uniref:Uncharacterized protein n=1 Tax=Janthinobacterium agaricidamnosum NBRC 102515 = DSM 9628 TaxID=1349767 RepID=W0V5A4_9BURK|nr:hypothetical protein [Janthinobacterium agaricidamnosum]CDG82432.1 putative uncharacterized protein [Janthinobacterium agaricidamnosum NBRC 102515 = DSM 9628]